MDIAENVAIVRSRIAEAALAAGRRPEDIRLVAATKMNDAIRVQQAIKAGVEICGENRVQEMLERTRRQHMPARGCILSGTSRRTR